jgi:hypothetical protein
VKKKRLFDPVRGREVADLPEERVRRGLVDWLVRVAGVPPRLVAVEYSLSALDPNRRDRADVVVWRPSEVGTGGGLKPWLLAECKAPSVSLGDATGDQVRRYAGEIRADHVLLTNGEETRCFRLDEGEARYIERRGLPPFPNPSPA